MGFPVFNDEGWSLNADVSSFLAKLDKKISGRCWQSDILLAAQHLPLITVYCLLFTVTQARAVQP
jgi:hypothetical protein